MVSLIDQAQTCWHIGIEENFDSPLVQRISPLSDEVLASFKIGRELEVSRAVLNARNSHKDWVNLSFVKRGQILRDACKLLEERSEEFASIVRLETGKSNELAKGELEAAVEFGYMMAAHGRLPIGKVLPSGIIGKNVQVTRNSLGVCALIVSFNTPLPNFAWKVFPALLSGNTAILKPSPYTPFSAWLFGKTLIDAGVPEGVLQVLQGDGVTGNLLVESDIDLISFTGSNGAGAEIATKASGRIVKTILELGGSNPFIVFEDAKIDNAVNFVIQSSFSNSGQRCAAGSRILLHKSIQEIFIEKLVNAMKTYKFGTSEDCFMGPVISADSAKRLKDFENECKKAGASIKSLGQESGTSRAVVQPKIVVGLDSGLELSQQEIFGPIARVFTFETEDEAVALANSTKYGLTAAVWTEDHNLAVRVAGRVSAGLVNINGPTHGAEPNMPFGGFGASGNGTREAGIESLNYYSDQKIIATFNTIT